MATFFVAGIIQGSLQDRSIHGQSYRDRLVGLLRAAFPDAETYCPIENYPNSLGFADEVARETFFGLMERAARADVLVAYAPEASMGTAIEMWQAHRNGRLVVAISPMGANWAIRFLSDVLLPDIAAFERFARSGELAALLAARGIIARSPAGNHPVPQGKSGPELQ
ncbi:MAG: hypothetical protein FJ290_14555 [Planctomycetes bacterium]|nr:hypothetical protein [Planctomycetota bacterium]